MGKVAMAIGHSDWRTVWTNGTGSPIGRRPSGLRMEDGKRVCEGKSVPREDQHVVEASGSASKGAANVVSDYCEMC